MIKNYFVTAWRNLVKSKGHSFINITGLAVGMAVALLIGLWIYDEISFNQNFPHYDRIGQLWQFVSFTSEKTSYDVLPIPLAQELRAKYPQFQYVSLSREGSQILAVGDKKLDVNGRTVEPDFPSIFSLEMTSGNSHALNDPHAILISRSLSKSLFGTESPLGKAIRLDNNQSLQVAGVFEDFPANCDLGKTLFLSPWAYFETVDSNAKQSKYAWDNNSWQIYAELKPGADFSKVSAKIKDIRMKKDNPPGYKPEFFIHPMSMWHLHNEFHNGVNSQGMIVYVRLFGVIGAFVLLLACINFMNLSTAKSEKRAKEVGVRKAIGSARRQLIVQFLSESLLVVAISFALCLVLVLLALPSFNLVSGKQVSIPWTNGYFWLGSLGFILFTGIISGSYPALYLSSFRPIRVLKGTFKAGRFAAIPRKALVVLQFSVSVILIIGTITVFRQIQYAKNLAVGYDRSRMIEIRMNTPELYTHYDALRADLQATGAVYDMSESSGSITEQYGGTTNISWRGKSPDSHPLVMYNSITTDYGKTLGWHMLEGRDFSKDFSSDSSAIILNQAAVKLMGFKKPLSETVTYHGQNYQVIGVSADMIKESPFKPVSPSMYLLNYEAVNTINIKLSGRFGMPESLAKVASVFKRYNPESPFDYKFVDEQYAAKFFNEERIGKLATSFAALAILISCLGLFGLASFVAEQRTKEIGVRKVLGASLSHLWSLISREFLWLVILSLVVAFPLAYYFMHQWLQHYDYRAPLSWWIFAVAGGGALFITLITVSYQGLKAAIANPVGSLRSE